MKKIIEIFKKQNGLKLIINYFKFGILGYALLLGMITAINKTGLEIFRLGMQNKTQKKLFKQNRKLISEFKDNHSGINGTTNKDYVWVCWFQGIDSAPDIVKTCVNSIINMYSNKNVIILDKNNFKDYVVIPKYILDKWGRGTITDAHFSDILRATLLYELGGIWIDATVLCTDKNIPLYIENDDLFFFQTLKPGRDGHALFISSWFISAVKGNNILGLTQALLYEYWKQHNYLVDYFLFHHFMCISCLEYTDEFNKVHKIDNSLPHILLLEAKNKYDEEKYNEITKMSSIHKLTYKYNKKDNDNYFYHIVENNT